MNGEFDLRYSNKRQLEAEEDSGTNSDLTEKHSSDVRQIPMVTSTKRIKNIEKEHENTVSRSSSKPLECPSSQFPYLHTQEQLKKILETRRFRNLQEKFNFQDSDDSDEDEEQNSIKTDHDHKQYELTMKAIRETLLKKPDD
ncbi:uncharacterized protein [Porites lutea]|uniref:uncharacterized protein isoform X1 n=1 Tax=Porites lutea TaxID=51062 RepID=UPI003CC6923E